MELRAIILGSGSSGGVPRIGGPNGAGLWGACDPSEPKNTRTRCSLLVQRADRIKGWDTTDLTSVLIDTSPDLTRQLIAARVTRLDAVMLSHDHADQTHGIDDLRMVAISMGVRVKTYVDDATTGRILDRFRYCFEQQEGSAYPAILDRMHFPPLGEVFEVDGPTGPIPVSTFLQHHGQVDSLGFQFGIGEGRIAYSSDIHEMPEPSFAHIDGVHTWIVDCLRYTPHPSHAHLVRSLEWLARVSPKHGVLTNLHIDLDYKTLAGELPAGIEPAFDGMVLQTI